MKNLNLGLVLAFVCITNLSIAQITTGSVEYKFQDVEMNIPEGEDAAGMDQMKQLFDQMTMVYYFKPGKQVMKMSMMGMMDITQIFENGGQIQYMDMMGQKMKIVTDAEALKKMGIEKDKIKDMMKVTYDENDTKDILGYHCYRADMDMDMSKIAEMTGEEVGEDVMDEVGEMTMSFYITEEIDMGEVNMQQIQGLEMKGAPLEMVMSMGEMMTMKFVAVNIDKQVDPANFNAPPGEYIEMSQEDLMKMGMDPNGFGF